MGGGTVYCPAALLGVFRHGNNPRLYRNLIKISNNPDRPIGGLDYFCKKIKKHLTI